MKLSNAALKIFIEPSEGLELEAYPDPGTGGIPWTIGYGHTAGVHKGDKCTLAQAVAWRNEDIETAEDVVNAYVKVPLTQHQFDALIDFVYNAGAAQFLKSTLLRLLNAGKYTEASAQFARWVFGGGVKLPGLVMRRQLETKWFNTED